MFCCGDAGDALSPALSLTMSGPSSEMNSAWAELTHRQAQLESDLAGALASKSAKAAQLAKLEDDLRNLQVERSGVAKRLDRMENIVLPAQDVTLDRLTNQLFEVQVNEAADVRCQVRKLELILDGLKTKRVHLEKEIEAGQAKWEKSVADWPATHKLKLKRAELAKAQEKVDAFVDKHGSLEFLGNEIEELQVALTEAQGSADQREQTCTEVKATAAENETVIRHLTAEIRTVRNRKAAKMKLLKKAMHNLDRQ